MVNWGGKNWKATWAYSTLARSRCRAYWRISSLSKASGAWQVIDGEPCRLHGLAPGGDLGVVRADECVVGDDGCLHLARCVAQLERVELLQIGGSQRGLLRQLAPGRLVERLIPPELPSGKRPVPFERLDRAADQQRLQPGPRSDVGPDAQDDDGHHDRRLHANRPHVRLELFDVRRHQPLRVRVDTTITRGAARSRGQEPHPTGSRRPGLARFVPDAGPCEYDRTRFRPATAEIRGAMKNQL